MTTTRYMYSDRESVHSGVVVAQPGRVGLVEVFIPPVDEELPCTVRFHEMGAAMAFATEQAQRCGGVAVMVTHDSEPWWLANLVPLTSD